MSARAVLPAGLGRRRAAVLAAALAVVGAAWLWLGAHGHDAGASRLGPVAVLWLVMMAAMMLPTILPWLGLVAVLDEARGGRRRSPLDGPVGFAAGYLLAWAAFAVVAAALQLRLRAAGSLDPAVGRLGPAAGAAVLALAGLYEWSGLKQACLRHCRSPLSFLLTRWRRGPAGAAAVGLRHGLYCLGCCWALMLVGFAVGVTSLGWMAALTAALCVEKMAPGGAAAGRILGAALVLAAGLRLAGVAG